MAPARMNAVEMETALATNDVPTDAIPKPIITREHTSPAFFVPK